MIWLDCVDNYTHSETWLQLTTPNVEEATQYLLSKGVETRDELEELPENMHWISDPSGTVFNLQERCWAKQDLAYCMIKIPSIVEMN